jgi:hypothetical protein
MPRSARPPGESTSVNPEPASMKKPKTEDTLADDLLDGAQQIADFIGVSKRRTFYLCESGQLAAAFKLGNRWCARKSELLSTLRGGGKAA